MTDFANYIIYEAAYWLRRDCQEHSATPNRSICVNEIKGRVTNEDWCALFVWRCVEDAARKGGAVNPLIHTPSTRAMLAAAQKSRVRVTTVPELGSVFFRPREGNKGHMGIVCGLDAQAMFCIEGNVSNRVGMRKYARNALQNYLFIHVQDQESNRWNHAPLDLRPAKVEWDAINVAQPNGNESINFAVTGGLLGAALLLGYVIYNQFYSE
jgi:hypothetical protein